MGGKKGKDDQDMKQSNEAEDLPLHTHNLRDEQLTRLISIHLN